MGNWQLSNGELSMSNFIFLVFFNTVYIFVLHIYIIIFSISLINRYKPRQLNYLSGHRNVDVNSLGP